MATTNIESVILLVVIILLILTAVFTACAVYRVVVWIWNYATEKHAERFLSRFGNHDGDFDSAISVAKEGGESGAASQATGVVRGWRRIRRNNIIEIAFGLADEAYLHFGKRDKSKANDLVTRKFLRDQLSEYDSLRAKDKSRIIEVALTLSYVPPSEWDEMAAIETTKAYARVVDVVASSTQ